MVILDGTIVYVALPSIDEALGFSAGGLQWVMSAYLLTFGGLLLLGGRSADLLGRRRMFMVGVALFAAIVAPVRARLVGSDPRRRPRAPGGRRGDPGADRAVALDDRVRRGAGAQQGARHLGRDRRSRCHVRPADRRPGHRGPRLGVGLLHQRPRRPRRARAVPGAPAREQGARQPARLRRRRGGDDHRRARPSGLCRLRGAGRGLDRRADDRLDRRRGRLDCRVCPDRGTLGGAIGPAAHLPLESIGRRQPRPAHSRCGPRRDADHRHPLRARGARLLDRAVRPRGGGADGDVRRRRGQRPGARHPGRAEAGRAHGHDPRRQPPAWC